MINLSNPLELFEMSVETAPGQEKGQGQNRRFYISVVTSTLGNQQEIRVPSIDYSDIPVSQLLGARIEKLPPEQQANQLRNPINRSAFTLSLLRRMDALLNDNRVNNGNSHKDEIAQILNSSLENLYALAEILQLEIPVQTKPTTLNGLTQTAKVSSPSSLKKPF